MTKISLITTVLNEKEQISSFLDSVFKQSLKPSEVIIVDGGSRDGTKEEISKFKSSRKTGNRIKLYLSEGFNRSQGRNLAIENSNNGIICVTDVGCVLDREWLKNITKPFSDKKVLVVSGYYLPKTETVFQKCVAPFFCVMPDVIARNSRKKDFEFLPSSRSVAFRKSVWEKVGGYPDKMNYCEDLVFDQKIKKAGFMLYFAPKAIVFWPQRKNIKAVFKQFFNYAYGDGQVFFSPYQTHSLRITLLFFRYLAAIFIFFLSLMFGIFGKILLLLIFLYFLKEILGKYKYVKKPIALLYIPLIKIIADFAVMAGTLYGLAQNESN